MCIYVIKLQITLYAINPEDVMKTDRFGYNVVFLRAAQELTEIMPPSPKYSLSAASFKL